MVKIKNLSAHEHVEDICNTFDGLSEMVEDRRLEHAGDDGTVLTEVQVEHLLTVVLSLVYQSGTNVAQFSLDLVADVVLFYQTLGMHQHAVDKKLVGLIIAAIRTLRTRRLVKQCLAGGCITGQERINPLHSMINGAHLSKTVLIGHVR